MTKTIIILTFTILFSGCVFTSEKASQTTQNTNTATASTPKPTEEAAKENKEKETKKSEKAESGANKAECLKAKVDGKRLIADQTFLFDYEPFPKSCFVTFAGKEDMLDEKDVPRGSTFHIYKNGEIIYDFEDAFDGMSGCWVEGVGFEDLSGDGKIEVIIAGKCLGNKDSYPMNAIYENYQDDFKTYRVQNENLDEFTTVKQIAEYAKKNRVKFFNRR